jgi:hypothetical protein
MVETTATYTLYIPTRCIYTTFTMNGSYLIIEDFTISKSINSISAFITARLDSSLISTA